MQTASSESAPCLRGESEKAERAAGGVLAVPEAGSGGDKALGS